MLGVSRHGRRRRRTGARPVRNRRRPVAASGRADVHGDPADRGRGDRDGRVVGLPGGQRAPGRAERRAAPQLRPRRARPGGAGRRRAADRHGAGPGAVRRDRADPRRLRRRADRGPAAHRPPGRRRHARRRPTRSSPAWPGSAPLPSIAAVAGRHAEGDGRGVRPVGVDPLGDGRPPRRRCGWTGGYGRPHRGPPTGWTPTCARSPRRRRGSAGYTGDGARVAVLDTGVDATHPDLAGQVVEPMDFTVDGGDAGDRYGHGTHVAATIAGTGAASGGARKGVAPDAGLVIGKVLDDDGEGTDSQVIAGMEWAASRADVVNMSLGGWDPSDGTDPLSLALDALSGQTGALFVVAAGNSGPLDGTVSSPGAAAERAHRRRGGRRRRGRRLLQPRTAGQHPRREAGDRRAGRGHRRRARGRHHHGPGDRRALRRRRPARRWPPRTSPARPRVLAQRHPDWQAGSSRPRSSARPTRSPAVTPYTSGAGRLDVAEALSGVVSNQPVVNLGTVAYPQSGTAEAKLAWANTGTRTATVALDVAVTDHHGNAAPAGAVPSRTARLRLAAGAERRCDADRRPRRVRDQPGLYTAIVTARVGRDVVARTPVTFYVEPPSHDLTVATTAIPGHPGRRDAGTPGLRWSTSTTRRSTTTASPATPVQHADVPGARRPVQRHGARSCPAPTATTRSAMAGDPDVAIAADTSLTLDLSQAKRLTASVDGVATEANSVGLTYIQMPRRGAGWTDFAFAWGEAAKDRNVFVAPNSGTGIGTFQAYAAFGLDAPGSGQSPYLYDLLHPSATGSRPTRPTGSPPPNRPPSPGSTSGSTGSTRRIRHRPQAVRVQPGGRVHRRELDRPRSPATAPTTSRPSSPGWTRRSGTGSSPRRAPPGRAGQPAGEGVGAAAAAVRLVRRPGRLAERLRTGRTDPHQRQPARRAGHADRPAPAVRLPGRRLGPST